LLICDRVGGLLICVKGSKIGGTEPCPMGRDRSSDWLEIGGYAVLAFSALVIVFILFS